MPQIRDNVDSYKIDAETYTLNQFCQRVSKNRPSDLVTRKDLVAGPYEVLKCV